MAAVPPVCDFGWKAVDSDLPGIDGKTHSIFGEKGPRGLVVAFICNHCPYVKAVIQRIVRDAVDLEAHGIGFVAISSNDAEAYPEDSFDNMKLFARKHGFSFPYLYDEDQAVARAYGAACTPDFFGFNRALEVQYRGRIDASRKEAGEPQLRRDRLLDQVETRRMSHEPAWPRAVLFDLDGTLIDSAPDICAAVNELLARRNLGPLDLDQVKSMIGNGVKKLVERAFAATGGPLPPAELDAQYMAMIDIYGRHLIKLTTLLPGAADALASLRSAGAALGLVTNKPQRFIETILDHFGLSAAFGAVIGGDAGVAKKPAPDMLLAAMDELGVQAWDTVMVGDSGSDVAAARAAGVLVVLRRGGYITTPAEALGADLVVSGLGDLAAALPALKPPA